MVKEKRTKQNAYLSLLLEVEANQKHLKALVDMKENIGDKVGKLQLWKGPGYDRTIYTAFVDKIGLLDPKSRENLVKYYGKLNLLEAIRGYIFEVSSAIPEGFSEEQNEERAGRKEKRRIGEEEVQKAYFKEAEGAYSEGEELIKSLNEERV